MIFKKIADFILFGSIFIAACAVALCMQTNFLLNLPFNNISFYCFVFGATLAQYNLHYLVKKTAVKNSQRLAWSLKNKKIHKILLPAGICLILFSFLSFRLHHFIILGILAIIAFLYSFPVIPIGKKKRIKDYGFMKIITLSLLWTLVTVWFPTVNFSFDKPLFALIFLERFTFMFVLCLVFDIRDIEIDRKENINTIAVLSGRQKSYFLTYFALVIFVLLSIIQFIYFGNLVVLIAMIISAVITFVTIEITKKTNSDFMYLAGIDGMMLLQPALVFLLSLKL
ncbi:MAG: UbiA family prenyltransferase [Bacteroidota bacterium]|nr:UbiA family prenyltransferase [Bacteroidota bacterium]